MNPHLHLARCNRNAIGPVIQIRLHVHSWKFEQKFAKETKHAEISAVGRAYSFATFVSFCSKVFQIGDNWLSLGRKTGINSELKENAS